MISDMASTGHGRRWKDCPIWVCAGEVTAQWGKAVRPQPLHNSKAWAKFQKTEKAEYSVGRSSGVSSSGSQETALTCETLLGVSSHCLSPRQPHQVFRFLPRLFGTSHLAQRLRRQGISQSTERRHQHSCRKSACGSREIDELRVCCRSEQQQGSRGALAAQPCRARVECGQELSKRTRQTPSLEDKPVIGQVTRVFFISGLAAEIKPVLRPPWDLALNEGCSDVPHMHVNIRRACPANNCE